MKRFSLIILLIIGLAFGVFATDSYYDLGDNKKGRSELDPNGLELPIDITIDWSHHEIHEGDSYHFSTVTELALNGIIEWIIFVSSDTDKQPHLRYWVNAEGATRTDLIEQPTTAVGVITELVYNHNRNKTGTADSIIMSMTNLSTGGTYLDPKSFAAGNNSPGQGATPEEWVLKAGFRYVIRVTSGAANNIVNLLIHFYESNGAP